jgi:DNA-binding response OmpR family regulator
VLSLPVDSFPAAAAPPAPTNGTPEAGSQERPAEAGRLTRAGEIRILAVDDDPSVCRVIQAALAQEGFVVDTVADPAQVEARLGARDYHLIVLDYVIPGLRSEQVLELLHQHQPDASIIVVTAFPSIDSALSCLRARTYDYLTKPFQVGHLQRVVTRCLESKGLLRLSEEALREALGGAIRERRKAQGLTLAQMAQRTGVSLGYLSQIELGKSAASVETLYRVSLGLGVRLAELFQAMQPSS